MRTMKDSGIEWIGEIPQEWNTTRIKYCTEIDREKLSEKTDPEYTFQYIDISGVTEYGGIGQTTEMTFEESPSRARMVVKPGDTIISTVRTYLKAVAYIDSLGDHICSTGFCVLSPKKDLFPKFAYYVLQSDYVVQKIVSESVGVSYPAISSTEIGDIKIALPEYVVQARIADYLDTKCAEIDALIAAKEKTNALLKERRQSIIYEAVTKGLDPTVPMKDSGVKWIGGIPEGWEIAVLKRLGTPATGSTPSKDNADYWDGDIPWVSSKDMKSDYLLDSEDHITQTAVDECGLTLFAPGTLIFCVRSGILRHTFPVTVATLPVTINQDLRALSLIGDVNPAFLLYYMRGMNDTIVTLYQKIGATVESIEMNWFLYFPVVLPSREEQDRIVEALDSRCASLDQTVKQNEATIRQLKEYRQSLIYEAVTGKIEV